MRLRSKANLRVYADGGRVVFEPVSLLGLLDVLETEAREKGYTREHIEQGVVAVREQLIKRLDGE